MSRKILSGQEVGVRHLMNADFLRRKVAETVVGNGQEFSGALVDPGRGEKADPVQVNGSITSVADVRSEIKFRNFEFMGQAKFTDNWAMLSFHETKFADFHFSGNSSELFLGCKTAAQNVRIENSTINGFFLCYSDVFGDVVFSESKVGIIFLQRSVIYGDLDLSGVKDVRHLALVELDVLGNIYAPVDPHLSFVYHQLYRDFGDRVVKGKPKLS